MTSVVVPIRAGGKGRFKLPKNHIAAMQVPAGGSCCANCRFVLPSEHACQNKFYIEWNGGDMRLPNLPLDEICSDWYEPYEDFNEKMAGIRILRDR